MPHHRATGRREGHPLSDASTRGLSRPNPRDRRSARKAAIASATIASPSAIVMGGGCAESATRGALIVERGDNALPSFARRVLDQAREIGDALGGGKPADGAHGLLAVRRYRSTSQSHGTQSGPRAGSAGSARKGSGEKTGHSVLTGGRERVASAPYRLDDLGSLGSGSSFRRSRLTCVSMLRSSALAARPRARSSSWSRLSTRCGRSRKAISRSYSPVLSGTRVPSSRSSYPDGRAGYLRWRRDQKQRHAAELRELLEAAGVDPAVVERAAAIVAKVGLGSDPEVQVFEDAVCLTFLETQLDETADRLDEAHMTNVIAKTLTKMSGSGKAAALTIDLDAAGQGAARPRHRDAPAGEMIISD